MAVFRIKKTKDSKTVLKLRDEDTNGDDSQRCRLTRRCVAGTRAREGGERKTIKNNFNDAHISCFLFIL